MELTAALLEVRMFERILGWGLATLITIWWFSFLAAVLASNLAVLVKIAMIAVSYTFTAGTASYGLVCAEA